MGQKSKMLDGTEISGLAESQFNLGSNSSVFVSFKVQKMGS